MPSYEKNKSSGLWSCRFREVDEKGISHNKRLSGFKTKKEAQYGYEDHIKQHDEELARKKAAAELAKPNPNDMLFDDLIAKYLSFTKGRTKETSYYDIESKVRNRITPAFTGKKMKDITAVMISDWIEGADYSYESKRWSFSTLSSIYRHGAKYYHIQNTIELVDRPKNLDPPKEMEIWTHEEFSQILPHVKKTPYELFYLFLYVTGCRRGEGAALTWEDIGETFVRINKSVSTKTKRAAYVVTTPKNKGSIRTIVIPRMLSEILMQYKEDQKAEIGDEWKPSMFVFGGKNPLPASTVDRYFHNAIKAAGVKRIRIHDLRHSCASLLISKGISIVAVSRQLGHKNIEQTLNTYSHLLPDDKQALLNTLEDLGTNLGTKK